MQVIRAAQTGGPEVMRLEELETPQPAAGELLVEVEAAGINYIDVYHRSGVYVLPLPMPLGLEGAGVVQAAGAGVQGFAAGDRVAWTGVSGSYASHVLVPTVKAVPIPAGMDTRTAAASMLQGLTSQYLARTTYPLKDGDTCLIHAGAGGVGLLLTQIAKLCGARVITTVSTEEKEALSRGAGADEVIRYTEVDFVEATKKATGGKGVQVVYDSVGKTTFDGSMKCLAPRGVLALFGQSSGSVGPFDPQRLAAGGSLFLTRPTLANFTATREELMARTHELFGWIARGEVKVRIGATFPLAQAAEAHAALTGRRTTGKVLLLP